jgi:phosphatidylserine/phosphatidylglycerophosphate/cardiolipin synthase-like enzyme
MKEKGIAERLQSCLSDEKYISLNEIKAAFPANDQWIIEIHLANMIDKGIIRTKGKEEEMTFMLKKRVIQQSNAAVAPKIDSTDMLASYSIVATLPESLLSMTTSIMQTRTAMRSLFSQACTEVLVSQPFVDNTFVDIYEDEIRAMAKRGIKLVLLTRKVATDTANIKAILKIFEIYSMAGQKTRFELYEHWIPLRIGQEQSKQFVGLHAKLIIGNDAAYIGSANWTGFSLSNNVELGMMVRDVRMLDHLREVYSMVITQSIKIDIEQIHRKLVYRARDQYG